MKTIHSLLATLLLVAIAIHAKAEDKLIKSDFTVRKNLSILIADKSGSRLKEDRSFAEFKVLDCGEEGTTVLLHFNIETVENEDNGKPFKMDETISWSGQEIALAYTANAAEEVYMVMFGNQACGQNAVARIKIGDKYGWVLSLTKSPEGSRQTSGIHQGMDIDALRAKFLNEEVPGKLTGGRQEGEYTVYDLISLGTKRRYKWNGDYSIEMNANTPYIRFYFKGKKLEKWVWLE